MGKFDHTITVAKAKASVDKLWFTQGDAARYLGVSARTVARLRENGKLPYCQMGMLVLIRKDDIDRMVERHRVY